MVLKIFALLFTGRDDSPGSLECERRDHLLARAGPLLYRTRQPADMILGILITKPSELL